MRSVTPTVPLPSLARQIFYALFIPPVRFHRGHHYDDRGQIELKTEIIAFARTETFNSFDRVSTVPPNQINSIAIALFAICSSLARQTDRLTMEISTPVPSTCRENPPRIYVYLCHLYFDSRIRYENRGSACAAVNLRGKALPCAIWSVIDGREVNVRGWLERDAVVRDTG